MISKNIILCGMGGQGIVLAGRIVSDVFYNNGYNVKTAEVIGVGQRGGSVIIHMRIGEEVYAPLIKPGTADYLLAFEKYEGLRWQHFLNEDGILIANDLSIKPNTVLCELEEDINVEWHYENLNRKTLIVSSDKHLKSNKIANKYMNAFLLGVFSNYCEFDEKIWIKSIERKVNYPFKDNNIEAFLIGRSIQQY